MRGIFFSLAICTRACFAHAAGLQGRLLPLKGSANFTGYAVWLEAGGRLARIEPSPGARAMRQVNKQFSPKILAIREGDGVNFENLDNVFHNVFSMDKRDPFDLGLYKGKKHFAADLFTEIKGPGSTLRTFSVKGKFHIFCNIHPDMAGTVYVFDHGYYAQADKDGLFSLPSVSPGSYVIIVDGPRLEVPVKTSVAVKEEARPLELRLRLERAPRRMTHARKDGEEYPPPESSY